MKKIEQEILQTKPFRNEYHRACVNLIYTGKWVINLHSESFKSYGITIQQFNILRILHGHYPQTATIKFIKKRMLDKMSDASRIVDTLVNKGLINRTINPNDRRKVDILILQEGIDLLNEIDKINDQLDKIPSKLTRDEIEHLNFLLDKVRF